MCENKQAGQHKVTKVGWKSLKKNMLDPTKIKANRRGLTKQLKAECTETD